jgi:hypothetical protein
VVVYHIRLCMRKFWKERSLGTSQHKYMEIVVGPQYSYFLTFIIHAGAEKTGFLEVISSLTSR